MHVLTKIFIVLVSLLAVLLVPLVVVYAYNENSYRDKFNSAESQKMNAQTAMAQETARAASETSALSVENSALKQQVMDLKGASDQDKASIRGLESRLTAAEGMKTEIGARLTLLAATIDANQKLTDSLVTELRQLRSDTVAIERQKVELDEANRDLTSQLEVAVAARRALEEELARIKDDHAKALTKLSHAVQQGFNPDRTDVRTGVLSPDQTLSAKVIRVERSSTEVLAEIDAGSRDGVKQNWSMTISCSGQFTAKLQITNVDINHSTGIITLESRDRGLVQPGCSALATAGRE